MDDPRFKILIIAASILISGGLIAGAIGYGLEKNSNSQMDSSGVASMKIDSTRDDFGDIKIDGGLVREKFEIKNTGDGVLRLSNIKTSCMCTSAYLEVDGEKSPKFGMHNNPTFWSEEIGPGQVGNMEIVFDPMAHGPDAIGPITRNVSIYSNDNGQKSVKSTLTLTANVIR